MKKLTSTLLILALCVSILVLPASAKTAESAKAENVFFYAKTAEGKNVLLKVIPLAELKAISHGQLTNQMSGSDTGKNYYISSTDNYPTTQYCEARGITVPELVDYVKRVTSVKNAAAIDFRGADKIRLMATDSYGMYNRVWSYDELYGVKRYYFEGLMTSWNTGWEISSEDDAKFGMTLEEYNEKFKNSDPYYTDKRAVFDGGVLTVPVLSTESFSGRTTTDSLVSSTEIGIADYIARNGGTAAGSLRDALEDTWSLRLALPMTEADLMAAHRTAFDNFKWTYNLLLEQANAPAIASLGTVAEPVPNISVNGNTLTITLNCATAGATIYYSFDGAPQTPYTSPITVDISGRNLAADPVTFYMTAVREGYYDAGIITAKYPGLAPTFKTIYSAPTGAALVFSAADGVSDADWRAWADAVTFVTIKAPGSGGYVRIDAAKIKKDNIARSITLDASLMTKSGSYSFIFHASGYADKSVSLTAKGGTPTVNPPKDAILGNDIIFTFSDSEFQNGMTLYVTPPSGSSTMISSSYLDRTQAGKLILKAAYFITPSCAIKTAGSYNFSLVNSKYDPGTVDVSVALREGLPVAEYTDVKASDWYYGAVRHVMSRGLFDTDGNSFGTAEPMTRAMLVTALYRLEGSPNVSADTVFTDVPNSAAYYDAVSWAASSSIVNGMGDGTFAPDASITREQIAALLHRYITYKKADTSAVSDLSVFTDSAQISTWAKDALIWANGAKIINGMGDGTVAPQGTATRTQVAQMLLNMSVL